jgi:hypothetical protein
MIINASCRLRFVTQERFGRGSTELPRNRCWANLRLTFSHGSPLKTGYSKGK